ncbi:hypothetical protein BGW39_004525 [Mortierella sp. 14UC]|nr:hypothetical protein BGW39_004525 [Mortierella sp. 14UC]
MQIIADPPTSDSAATLAALARVNRYTSIIALPFLYRNPFKLVAKAINSYLWTRMLIQTLLAHIPVTELHPALSFEMGLNDATTAGPLSLRLEYLHIRRLPSSYINKDRRKESLLWSSYQVVVFRETIWALAIPVLEQLETLSILLSDIRRYFKVIDRLSKLEQIDFVMDEVYEDSTEADMLSTTSGSRNVVMQEMAERLIYKALPPLHKPKMITNSNWGRHLSGVTADKGAFDWAVQEKRKSLCAPGSGSIGRFGDSQGSQSTPATRQLDLVPLEGVTLYDYRGLIDEVDNIAYAFSQTLRCLVIDFELVQGQPTTIQFGQGWVELPVMTNLILKARCHRLVLDPMLLTLCPSLSEFEIIDGTTEYQCKDIEPCLPVCLPKLEILDLQGWAALTFHPAALDSAPLLRYLALCSSNSSERVCFIPPKEELDRSYGGFDDGPKSQTATPGPGRPLWTWDWRLPMLTYLEFNGEFAMRFQFRMLVGCPSLKTLSLNIYTADEQYTRVLSHADFFLSPDDATSEQQLSLEGRAIVAKCLTMLTLDGLWVVDDTLLPHLVHAFLNPRQRNVLNWGCTLGAFAQRI